ncbi:MAG: Ig-like domain-containing protein [Thermodesulfovibrionales bacterium]|nr:Ig-like domain-containing protein [Thermodesulfovibrionales bacterium]
MTTDKCFQTRSGIFLFVFISFLICSSLQVSATEYSIRGGTGIVDGASIPLPDLTGQWDPISQTCKNTKSGIKCKVKGTLRINNSGTENALTSVVRYYLSQDAAYDGTDMELKRVSTGAVKTGKTKSKTFSYSFPTGSSAFCQYVIAVIDTDNAVEEISEANNQVMHFFDNGECTDTTPPSVILTSPAGNAVEVSVNTVITAMFSEALDPSTVTASTFTVNGVTGTVAYSGTTAMFTPSGILAYDTAYTVILTTGVRDNAGNAMVSDYGWSFTTGSSTGPPPTTLTNLFFLHHSTGDGLVVEGNMRSVIASYNSSHGTEFVFWDHGYSWDGLRNPSGEFTGTNYDIPGDNTNPDGLYNLWTSVETEYVNARNQILNNHQVIAFKSCFPASQIPDAATLAQYQTWYLGMRDFFDTHTDRLFIVMSTPPLHHLATNATEASNARAFADWLCSDAYLSGHPNVRCFNLFDYLANHNDGSATANMLRYEYEGSHSDSDSHPNAFANQTVGPVFANFLCDAALGY